MAHVRLSDTVPTSLSVQCDLVRGCRISSVGTAAELAHVVALRCHTQKVYAHVTKSELRSPLPLVLALLRQDRGRCAERTPILRDVGSLCDDMGDVCRSGGKARLYFHCSTCASGALL